MREGGRPSHVVSHAPREMLQHARASFRLVASRKPLVWAIGYSSVVFVLLRATEHVYQPYLRASGFSVAETGVIYAAVYLVAAVVAHNFATLRRWLSESTLIWTLLGTLIVTFLILGNIAGPLALAVMTIQNAANGLYSPLSKLLLQREIPDSQKRATVLSVESMVRRLAYGAFAPVIGFLMDRYGPGAGLTICGVFGLVGMVALAPTLRFSPRAVTVPPRIAPELPPD
jgi:predicted MFS family arabinose efflux permease